jgi:hypothetical protein
MCIDPLILHLKLDIYHLLPNKSYNKSIMLFKDFKEIVLAGNPKVLQGYNVVVLPFIAIDLG